MDFRCHELPVQGCRGSPAIHICSMGEEEETGSVLHNRFAENATVSIIAPLLPFLLLILYISYVVIPNTTCELAGKQMYEGHASLRNFQKCKSGTRREIVNI